MRTYLQSIAKQPEIVQEALIREAPYTVFRQAPTGLEFLTKGIVDLGFENLGLGESEFKQVMAAFSGEGIIIPGTPFKIRALDFFQGVIEKTGRQKLPILPENWKEAVMVFDKESNEIVYAGSLVRRDQIGTTR